MSDPAIAVVEFDSIAAGIFTGDAMVKAAPIGSIYAGTVHPGKYLVLVSGDTASVEVALETGRDTGARSVIDSIFLPAVHDDVVAAIVSLVDAAGGLGAMWQALEPERRVTLDFASHGLGDGVVAESRAMNQIGG